MTGVRIAPPGRVASSCYFRTSVQAPYRKALLQITERCNLSCAHCFVSAGREGDELPRDAIREIIIPRLIECRVVKVTLTGGEPFLHPDLVGIVEDLRAAGFEVGICTNATLISDDQMDNLLRLGKVHVNVSLDGFRPESHGRFRGDPASFQLTIDTIRKLGERGLLQGILSTPNALSQDTEYVGLHQFARDAGAKYVLMNPLSRMGRGVKSQTRLAASDDRMANIEKLTSGFGEDLDLVRIRFPNKTLPLSACEAGNIVYIFVDGSVTVCPYLVFAANAEGSQHKAAEFVPGNILSHADIASRLDSFNFHARYPMGHNTSCGGCSISSKCGKGCPAAVVAAGGRIGDLDREVCPTAKEGGVT